MSGTKDLDPFVGEADQAPAHLSGVMRMRSAARDSVVYHYLYIQVAL